MRSPVGILSDRARNTHRIRDVGRDLACPGFVAVLCTKCGLTGNYYPGQRYRVFVDADLSQLSCEEMIVKDILD
jgi:hypothetical protein